MAMKSRTLANISAMLVVMIISSAIMFRPVLSQSPESQPAEDHDYHEQDQKQGHKETENEKHVEDHAHHEHDNEQQADDQEQGHKETAKEKHVEDRDNHESYNKQEDDQEQGHKESADEKYFKSLPGEFREYVNECAKQISKQCGEEIFASILNKSKVSTICCHDLVEMGLQCHNALVRFVAISPKYKHMAVQITGSSREVFNHCVQVDN